MRIQYKKERAPLNMPEFILLQLIIDNNYNMDFDKPDLLANGAPRGKK